jgi:hypothetical protein
MKDENMAYIVAAYALTWCVILGYAIRVHRALGQARAELRRASEETERSR